MLELQTVEKIRALSFLRQKSGRKGVQLLLAHPLLFLPKVLHLLEIAPLPELPRGKCYHPPQETQLRPENHLLRVQGTDVLLPLPPALLLGYFLQKSLTLLHGLGRHLREGIVPIFLQKSHLSLWKLVQT